MFSIKLSSLTATKVFITINLELKDCTATLPDHMMKPFKQLNLKLGQKLNNLVIMFVNLLMPYLSL